MAITFSLYGRQEGRYVMVCLIEVYGEWKPINIALNISHEYSD